MAVEAWIDLRELAGRLANRSLKGRTEATVQSDVRMLLLASGLNLAEGDVLDVKLESPLADRRRIDIEMGRTVIEVKRSLAPEGALADAATQLAGYVEAKSSSLGQRYVGKHARRWRRNETHSHLGSRAPTCTARRSPSNPGGMKRKSV